MYTRASPYGFGLFAAYSHMYLDKSHSYLLQKSYILTEWAAFIVLIVIPLFCHSNYEVLFPAWNPYVNMIWAFMIRG